MHSRQKSQSNNIPGGEIGLDALVLPNLQARVTANFLSANCDSGIKSTRTRTGQRREVTLRGTNDDGENFTIRSTRVVTRDGKVVKSSSTFVEGDEDFRNVKTSTENSGQSRGWPKYTVDRRKKSK